MTDPVTSWRSIQYQQVLSIISSVNVNVKAGSSISTKTFMMIHAEASDIPVLFCTGYSRDTLAGSFSDTEKTAVLQKPYAAADLLEAVKNLTQNNW